MTTHLSWLNWFPPVDRFEVEDVHHTDLSEFQAGPSQAADYWERSKVAYQTSFVVEYGETAKLEALLWLKRALHGRAIPVWIPEPFERMLTDEPVGTGDGSQVAWILPILDADGGSYAELHLDGVKSGTKIFGAANLLSAAAAEANDSSLWTATGGSVALSSDYRWQWVEQIIKGTATGAAVLELELTSSAAFGAVEVGYEYFGFAHCRGDVTPNVRAGIAWYNSTPTYLSTSWGSGVAISDGAWTLVSSGTQTAPASAAFGAVVVDTVSNASASETLYLGGVGLSAYAAEWFHPDGAPAVVQFAIAPTNGDEITYTGRAHAMRRMRAQKDNLKHVHSPAGHASMARISFLEDVE